MHWYHPELAFEAGLCNCGTLSLFLICLIKTQAGTKITCCGGESSPHTSAEKGGRVVLWDNNTSVLCGSLESSLVSLNLFLLVRMSYIPDGQSPGYSKSLQLRLWDQGPALFCLFSSTVETLCLPAVPVTSSTSSILEPCLISFCLEKNLHNSSSSIKAPEPQHILLCWKGIDTF